MKAVTVSIKEKEIEDFDVFSCDFVKRLAAENEEMERIINSFLQSGELSREYVDKIVRCSGSDLFTKFPDGTYAWRGMI